MRYLFILLFSVICSFSFAQTETTTSPTTATPKSEATAPAEHNSANDNAPKATPKKKSSSQSSSKSRTYSGKRARSLARGYRVQVYSGAGGTKSKEAAQEMAAKVRAKFPGMSVYCRFRSPRWVCRIGDFPTKAVAQHFLRKVQLAKISNEASIVIDDVFLAK